MTKANLGFERLTNRLTIEVERQLEHVDRRAKGRVRETVLLSLAVILLSQGRPLTKFSL
jgi:hypothetical protein